MLIRPFRSERIYFDREETSRIINILSFGIFSDSYSIDLSEDGDLYIVRDKFSKKRDCPIEQRDYFTCISARYAGFIAKGAIDPICDIIGKEVIKNSENIWFSEFFIHNFGNQGRNISIDNNSDCLGIEIRWDDEEEARISPDLTDEQKIAKYEELYCKFCSRKESNCTKCQNDLLKYKLKEAKNAQL